MSRANSVITLSSDPNFLIRDQDGNEVHHVVIEVPTEELSESLFDEVRGVCGGFTENAIAEIIKFSAMSMIKYRLRM